MLSIAEDRTLLHRLDAAYFQVGEAHGALLVKFTGGEATPPDELRAEMERHGLAARRLEAEGRMRFIPEPDATGDRAGALRQFVEAALRQEEVDRRTGKHAATRREDGAPASDHG